MSKKPELRIGKLTEIQQDPKNANRHSQRGRDTVERSLRQRGFLRPMAAAGKGVTKPVMLAGNLTQETAVDIGMDEAIIIETDGTRPIVHVRTDVEPGSEEAILLGLEDNRSAELSLDWDPIILKELSTELELSSLWNEEEFKLTLDGIEGSGEGKGAVEDTEAEVDRAEELREKWSVQSGQLWQLREHRLLVGDSTKREDVERVMEGEKADAVVTDPPYGVGVEYATFKDTEANTEKVIRQFMPIVLSMNCPVALTPGVPVMWSYPQPAWVMVWVDPAPVGGCSWGFSGVNPILVYGKDPYLAAGMGRRPDHIVMAAGREGVEGHPTPKPIKVWIWLVERLTIEAGQVVYEPFCGSGTTIMACEQLGRKARAIEISPAYVAVSLERFYQATKQQPKLL